MDRLISIGTGIILVGFLLVTIGALAASFRETPGSPKVAVGGFIGFIPFGFANDRRMLYPLIALMLVLFILWIIVFRQRGA